MPLVSVCTVYTNETFKRFYLNSFNKKSKETEKLKKVRICVTVWLIVVNDSISVLLKLDVRKSHLFRQIVYERTAANNFSKNDFGKKL